MTIFNAITGLSRTQKSYIFLGIDLLLLPLALLFTYAVQDRPTDALALLGQMLPILPYILGLTGALSVWLGLPKVQLIAYEQHAMGLTALVAFGAAAITAGFRQVFGPQVSPGMHVVFALSYLLMMVAMRGVLYQVVLSIYRRARPRARVLIYGPAIPEPSWPRRSRRMTGSTRSPLWTTINRCRG